MNEMRQLYLKVEHPSDEKMMELIRTISACNAYIAGGFARYLLHPELSTSDIDVVFYDDDSIAPMIRLQNRLTQKMGYVFSTATFNAVTFRNEIYDLPPIQLLIKRVGKVGSVLNQFTLHNEQYAAEYLPLDRALIVTTNTLAEQATATRNVVTNKANLSSGTLTRVAKYARKVEDGSGKPIYTLPNVEHARLVTLVCTECRLPYALAATALDNLLRGDFLEACEMLGVSPSY